MAATPSPVAGARAALDLRHLARLGETIERARATEQDAIDAVADEVLRARQSGGRPNVTLAAKLAGIARDTLYARVAKRSA